MNLHIIHKILTQWYLLKHFNFLPRNIYRLTETIKIIMSVILKQACLAQEESVDCMVYRALRVYQDHQVSEAPTLPHHRHYIVLAASLIRETSAM